MFLRQDAICQVLHKRAPLILADENNIAFLLVCCKLTGLASGLDLIHVLTHAWLRETRPLKSAVQADFFAELAGFVMYFF